MSKRKRHGWQEELETLGERIAEKVGRGLDRMADRIDNVRIKVGTDTDLSEHIQEAQYRESVGDARTAVVNLHMGLGKLTVTPTEDDDTLFSADLRYVGEASFDVSGGDAENPTKTVTLRQETTMIKFKGHFSTDRHELYTHVKLNPRIPTYLTLNGGVSSSELDLRTIQLTGLRFDGGVGEMKAYLPAMPDPYRVAVEGGVGRNRLYVPDDAAIAIDIDDGVGGTVIYVSETAAVSLEVTGTIGGVSVPDHLQAVRQERRFVKTGGLWQTENYAEASRKITIRADGGVGALKIRSTPEDEPVIV